ncbi:MAG TPA: ATPase, partial [Synechococcus sp. UBA8071]|nr:ATPase [Synechococcus sp. UBA8071]
MVKDAPKTRQTLKLLLVAARHHLSGQDLRSLVQFLEREDLGFEVTLQV